MEADQELSDRRANRKARNVIEKIMGVNILASFATCTFLLYIRKEYGLLDTNYVDLFSFYPEHLFIGKLPDNVKIAVMTSNIYALSYVAMHLFIMKSEVIRDR